MCIILEYSCFLENLVRMSFDFKNKSLILKFLERWVFENFLVKLEYFVINKSLKGKCEKLWKNERMLDLRVVKN